MAAPWSRCGRTRSTRSGPTGRLPRSAGSSSSTTLYAGESSAAKRARLGDEIGKKKADWLLLTGADSIAWLLNIRGRDIPYNPLCLSFALLGADATCRWFVDPGKLPADLDLGNGVAPEPAEGFLTALDELGRTGARVLVDPAEAHLGYLERLKAAGAKLVEADNPVLLAKACKNAVEIEGCGRRPAPGRGRPRPLPRLAGRPAAGRQRR